LDKLTLSDIEQACTIVYREMNPTAQYAWPLLSKYLGVETWVKHENHTPTGAFKVRGGLTFMDWLTKTHPDVKGIITATRGNHGQSQAFAATRHNLSATILAPKGNSQSKNEAMEAFGGELILHGQDFDEARIESERLSHERGLFLVPSFHHALVRGVSTYGYELMNKVRDLDVIFVPIGCGSGICATIMARDALNLKTKIIGVVSDQADCAKQSFDAKKLIETSSARTFADGMAVRVPVQESYDIYARGAEDVISVSDAEIADAIRLYFHATHNIAEGAGAAPLAALRQQRARWQNKKIGVILCGQNIDQHWFSLVLAGDTPQI